MSKEIKYKQYNIPEQVVNFKEYGDLKGYVRCSLTNEQLEELKTITQNKGGNAV